MIFQNKKINLTHWKWFARVEKKNFEYDIINFVVVLKFWSVLFWEIWILFKNIRLFRKFFDGFMLILCLLYLDLHGARCLTAGTCAAHFMPCALPHPSSASRQKKYSPPGNNLSTGFILTEVPIPKWFSEVQSSKKSSKNRQKKISRKSHSGKRLENMPRR